MRVRNGVALLLLGVALAGTGVSAGAQGDGADDGAPLLLAAADRLRAEAAAQDGAGRGALLLAALTLTARADGRVHAPGGAPADIGYQSLWAETERAVRGDPGLSAALARLPAPSRGAGWQRRSLSVAPQRPWHGRIAYEGGTVAMLYARSADGDALRLRVADPAGRTLCDRQGAALCVWHPQRAQPVAVTVTAQGTAPVTFDLLTN